jgi:ParB family chromosome partitioning protein
MSNRRSTWIDRRGQRGADAAIDQVIDRQPQAGEHVQQLADALIEDSPYQARQTFSPESVEELAQGMRQAGFQGVLIVRPHSDPMKRRRGIVQLVYGHRRRIAWQQVCVERGAACLVPVVVREIDDAQLLTIGAQENLQRQDLDPLEEAQIVAWHEQVYFDKNQAELGAMLGKSSDWVSVRSRIHKLPDGLKECLRQRPRAIAQMLELGPLHTQQPEVALVLADRVVQENLTLDAIRSLVRGYARPEVREALHIGSAERRGTATKVQTITNNQITDQKRDLFPPSTPVIIPDVPGKLDVLESSRGQNHLPEVAAGEAIFPADSRRPAVSYDVLLQQAAETLALLASHTEQLPINEMTKQLLDQLEVALSIVRRAFANRPAAESSR